MMITPLILARRLSSPADFPTHRTRISATSPVLPCRRGRHRRQRRALELAWMVAASVLRSCTTSSPARRTPRTQSMLLLACGFFAWFILMALVVQRSPDREQPIDVKLRDGREEIISTASFT